MWICYVVFERCRNPSLIFIQMSFISGRPFLAAQYILSSVQFQPHRLDVSINKETNSESKLSSSLCTRSFSNGIAKHITFSTLYDDTFMWFQQLFLFHSCTQNAAAQFWAENRKSRARESCQQTFHLNFKCPFFYSVWIDAIKFFFVYKQMQP